jgi:hypothetical protein
LTLRAITYCSNEELLNAELQHLRQVFLKNGFPLQTINKIINSKTHPEDQPVELDPDSTANPNIDYKKSFFAPYHPLARSMFRRLETQFGLTCVYKKTPNLGNYLLKRRPKPSIWDIKNTVYSVPCEDPNHEYIGQTKRKLGTRRMEHEKSCITANDPSTVTPNNDFDNGIPYHHATTGHNFLFENIRILEKEPNYLKRKILEGIHITNKQDRVVNIISGQKISQCWTPIIARLKL